MSSDTDERWMRFAIDEAALARGIAEPNPTVGCVLVRDGTLIGRGHTHAPGQPHAEPSALASVDGPVRGATAYVTLEPCCHTGSGKRTPPCVPHLIDAGITRVVVGCVDPSPQVSGRGIAQLQAAGIDVVVGVLETQCRQLIAPFLARLMHARPYVTLKWAVSRDGCIAGRKGRPVRISNATATQAVHALRGRCDAIAIGTNTLVNDDPLLTARTMNAPRRPLRVVFSNSLYVERRRLFETPGDGPVLIYTSQSRSREVDIPGVEIVGLPDHDNGRGGVRFSINDAYADLCARGVTHLLIEPGLKLATELIARNQFDRIWEIGGQNTIGDDGLAAPDSPFDTVVTLDLAGDTLVESLNPMSSVYFGPHPSSDFALTARSIRPPRGGEPAAGRPG